MTKPRGDPDFLQEPVAPDRGRELRPQDLDRDLAIVLQVVGQVDRGHAALAQLPLDPVAVGEGWRKALSSMVKGGRESWVVGRGFNSR